MVERTHRHLKDALRVRCSDLNLANHLPWVLLGLRTTRREDTGLSLAQAVLGCNLALPADHPDAQPPKQPLQEELETLHAIREAGCGPVPMRAPSSATRSTTSGRATKECELPPWEAPCTAATDAPHAVYTATA